MRKNIKGFIVELHEYEDVHTGEHLASIWLSAPTGKVIAWDEVSCDELDKVKRAFTNAARILASRTQ